MIAFDTNILVYAEDPGDPLGRHERAAAILGMIGLRGGIVPVQVLGEFINACRKKTLIDPELAIAKVASYAVVFDVPETAAGDIIEAAMLAERQKLQYFDALIITVAKRAGATVLLSEDMQDGLVIGDLTVLNPFKSDNIEALDRLLA